MSIIFIFQIDKSTECSFPGILSRHIRCKFKRLAAQLLGPLCQKLSTTNSPGPDQKVHSRRSFY